MININELDYIFELARKNSCDCINAIIDFAKRIVNQRDYAKDKSVIDSKVHLKKYSKGTYLMGACGYYYPSDAIVLIMNNVRRGRVVKESKCDFNKYVYEYDQSGNLLRILYLDTNLATHKLTLYNYDIFITYEKCHTNPTCQNFIISRRDESGILQFMVDIFWSIWSNSPSVIYIENYYVLDNDRREYTLTEYCYNSKKLLGEQIYGKIPLGRYILEYSKNKAINYYTIDAK